MMASQKDRGNETEADKEKQKTKIFIEKRHRDRFSKEIEIEQ